jgi:hypothetical protein
MYLISANNNETIKLVKIKLILGTWSSMLDQNN